MSKLKILQLHNYYLQSGGEDTAFEADVALLRDHGHEVVTYTEQNERISTVPPAIFAAQTIYSRESYRRILNMITSEKPDIAHFHNTFPVISPSAYYACRKAGIPVIQSLHNPRLICPAASFYRNGKNCIDCLGKTPPYPGVVHGCYHNSRTQTGVIATMLTVHRLIGTWEKMVDKYLVATKFYYDLFIRAGLPEGKIEIKPHFVEPTIPYNINRPLGGYALFIGRLDPEKGIGVLLEAWKKTNIPMKIRGSGQMESEVRQFIDENPSGNIELIGRLPKDSLGHLMDQARFLVWPTQSYYETFGFVAVESFAIGLPVIGSRIGVNAEMISEGITGLNFTVGDPDDLADKMRWAWDHPNEMAEMGRNGRREYETKYTASINYKMLIEIYERTIEGNQGRVN
jgi:glycosyltransferase involved in cell wall biosynthesis